METISNNHSEQDEIMEAARAVAARFRGSTLYRDYLRHKAAIEEQPELSIRIAEYKKKQAAFEFMRLQSGSSAASFDEEKYISHLYTSLRLNEHAGPFLACENALLDLYRKVFETIAEACPADTPF